MKRFLMMMALIGLVGNWNSTLTAQLVSPDSLYLNEDLPEINIVAVKPLIKAEADYLQYRRGPGFPNLYFAGDVAKSPSSDRGWRG